MKKLSYVTAVSLFLSAPAFAGQGAAFSALLGSAKAPVAVAAPAAPVAAAPEDITRALASDVLDLSANYADFLVFYAKSNGYTVIELDGARMTGKAALLSYSAGVLRLPGVPENWDALIDYIGDLPGIHQNPYIIIVTRNANRIRLADEAMYADFREVAEFACRNAREWSKGELTIKFAFVQ